MKKMKCTQAAEKKTLEESRHKLPLCPFFSAVLCDYSAAYKLMGVVKNLKTSENVSDLTIPLLLLRALCKKE